MVGAAAGGLGIGGGRHSARLRPFLQRGLGVAGIGVHLGDAGAPEPQDQHPRGVKARVLVDGGDDGLQRVAQQRLFPPSAGQHLGPAQLQHLAQADLARHGGTGFLAHQGVEAGRKLPLARAGVGGQERLGHDKAQDPVAQEFQPLVVRPRGAADRGMGDGPHQQFGRAEPVAKPTLKGQQFGRQPHSIALK